MDFTCTTPTSPKPQPNRLGLLDLPVEVLEHIVKFVVSRSPLASASLLALRISCRPLRNIVRNLCHLPDCKDDVTQLTVDAPLLYLLEEWDCYSVPLPAVLLKTQRLPHREAAALSRFQAIDARPFWASKVAPKSRHACTNCFRLRPSSAFTTSQVTKEHAKKRDGGRAKVLPSSRRLPKRFCIDCRIKESIAGSHERMCFVEHWETEPIMGTGFVCHRHVCRRFVRCEVGGEDEDVEGGLDSPEYLRRMCSRCLDYRKPGGDYAPARGHIMR